MRGWHASGYGPDDEAMELRFLLGFSLKHADDPFYKVPKGEAAADAYFEGRMARYRMWAGNIAPLLARCLSPHPGQVELNFLYQDLFYGAKGQGVAELAMLATLAEVNGRLDELDQEPERIKAVVAPVDLGTTRRCASTSTRWTAAPRWPASTSRSTWRPTSRSRWKTCATRWGRSGWTACWWRAGSMRVGSRRGLRRI
jgi:hypothetical protein